MYYNPDIHHRRSIRLKGYDYSQAGMYFITICTQNRVCLFGEIINGEMFLNDAGKMIDKWWKKIEEKFPDIDLADFIIMPNHFHCIIVNTGVGVTPCVNTNVGVDPCVNEDVGVDPRVDMGVGVDPCVNTGVGVDPCVNPEKGEHVGSPQQVSPQSVSSQQGSSIYSVVQWFKTMTTNEYIRGVKQNQYPPFDKKLWQRNYWEHIIRNQKSFDNISNYIRENPKNWEKDKLFAQ